MYSTYDSNTKLIHGCLQLPCKKIRNILQIIIESPCTRFGHSESHEWYNVKNFFLEYSELH